MSYEEFVSEIANTAPSYSSLVSLGLTEYSASKMISVYHLQRRKLPLQFVHELDDGIIGLLNFYDTSGFEIGHIEFLDKPIRYSNFLHFASVERDLLILSSSGEILVVDWQSTDHIMWKCAVDENHFLDALVLASQFLTLTIVDKNVENDDDYALQVADSVAEAAGGKDYISFYQMLFGV